MPFDAPIEVSAELWILDKMKEILATPDKWFQQGYCNWDQSAVCILGALNKALTGNPLDDRWGSVGVNVRDSLGDFPSVFNDKPSTTHADILALLDRAREKIIVDGL